MRSRRRQKQKTKWRIDAPICAECENGELTAYRTLVARGTMTSLRAQASIAVISNSRNGLRKICAIPTATCSALSRACSQKLQMCHIPASTRKMGTDDSIAIKSHCILLLEQCHGYCSCDSSGTFVLNRKVIISCTVVYCF